MTDEVTPSTTESVPAAPETPQEPPSDFREYNKWRDTGVLPGVDEPATAVVEETPPVKTAPESGPEVTPAAEEESEETEKSRPNGRVRKIDRLTREVEMLKSQLAATQQPPRPPATVTEMPKSAEPAGKPRLHDFSTLEAYQEALTDWKLDQREAANKAAAEQAAAQAQAAKIQTDWQSAETAARTTHADYDDVIESVKAPEGPGVLAMRQAMLEDESGGEILYYLATHDEELKRIAALPPVKAVKEIGKLAGQLSSKPSATGTPRQQVTSAPKPPPPLSRPSASPHRDSIFDEEVAKDYKRWNRARDAQLKG